MTARINQRHAAASDGVGETFAQLIGPVAGQDAHACAAHVFAI
jgi:hypothetical protein